MYTKSSYPLLVVVVIAMALCLLSEKLSAQIDPTSLCAHRPNVVFSSGVEDLSEIIPIGLQDCSSLENHFDEDLNDSNPLVVSLDGDQSYDFATLRSLAGESTQGAYTVVALDDNGVQIPLPDWIDFDGEFGVSSASPSCADQGSYLLEFNIAPGEGSGSVNPLFVQYEVSCPSTLSVEGLGVISDSEVTLTGRFDYSLDSVTNTVNRPVRVREGRSFIPYDVHVLTNKQDVDVSVVDCIGCYDASANANFAETPDYISAIGNRLDFLSPDGSQGDSGTLELLVCDVASPSDCASVFVPWEITDVQAKLAGYSSLGPYETVTNPNDNGGLRDVIEASCVGIHEGYIIPEEIYKGQGFEGANMPAGMGVNSNTGRVSSNFDCDTQLGQQYAPSFTYGNSGSMTAIYEVTSGSTQQSSPSRKSDRIHGHP